MPQQKLEQAMFSSSVSPETSAVAVIDRPSSEHPAYFRLLDIYRQNGQSAAGALAVLAQEWDTELLGPLPAERTVRYWARTDAWADKIREAIDAHWQEYHRHVGMQLRMAAPLAVRTLEQVLSGEYPEPKMAPAAVRAALAVLATVGFGKGSLSPEATAAATAQQEQAEQARAIAAISRMTPEQVLQRRREAVAGQRQD